MKPPFSYYGGKQRMAHNILPLIPKHTVYVEPFCGGATILFQKPWPNVTNSDYYREVINDSNKHIVNFFRVLQDKEKAERLCYMLSMTLYSEDEHKRAKNLDEGDDVQQALAWFVNVNCSFSNVVGGGWGRGLYGRNLAFSFFNKCVALNEYIDRMRSVTVCCQDALTVIEQFDSPQTFFYCDPPYTNTDCGHYKGYTIEDYAKLIDTLDKCQGSFLLSNYEQPGIKIPSEWECFSFESVNSSCGRVGYDRSKKDDESSQNRKRTEIVYRRFNRIPVRKELQDLYDKGLFDCFCSKNQGIFDDNELF